MNLFGEVQHCLGQAAAFFANNTVEQESYPLISNDLHPLMKIFQAKTVQEYKTLKPSFKQTPLYPIFKNYRRLLKEGNDPDKLARIKTAVTILTEDIFYNKLGQVERNQIYGLVYRLAQVNTADPQWGEHNVAKSIPRLILALDLAGHLGRPLPSCKVWEKFEKNGPSSGFYSLGRTPLAKGEISYINGIATTKEVAKNDAERLSSSLASGSDFSCIYNASQGVEKDIAVSVLLAGGTMTPASRLLLDQWYRFFSTHSNDEKLLQICFSQGALHVKNALECLPPPLRKRICVISIAPACFIQPMDGCQIVQFYKKEDEVAEKYAFARHHRENNPYVIRVINNDSCDPHDPHGPSYTEAIRPFVQKFMTQQNLY